jgi:CspA family cold shock protein
MARLHSIPAKEKSNPPADLEKHPMQKGTIKRLIADHGFGFIKTEREEDLFFGRSQLQGVDYGSLKEGQKVEFQVTRDPNGHLHAIRVRLAQAKGE